MKHNLDDSLLPPCCNSGCTVCVLDYPEQFLAVGVDESTLAMLTAIEQADQQIVANEESQWTNNEKMN